MTISAIFGNQKYSILVDSAQMITPLSNIEGVNDICLLNIDANFIETFDDREATSNFIFVCTNWDSFVKFRNIKGKRILLLPQVAFDVNIDALIYSIQKLLASDFEYAVTKHHEWYPVFSEIDRPLSFWGRGSDLRCDLSQSIEISTINNILLEVDNPRSVAEYFEIALENRIDQDGSFKIDGYLDVEGFLMAKGIDFRLENYNRCFADNLMYLVSQSSSMKIIVNNNKLTSVLIDNIEYLNYFTDLISEDKTKLPNITEFAIGFNYKLQNNVNWNFNSQVNEGIEGLHLGIGNGEVGYHFDFITTNIQYYKNLC